MLDLFFGLDATGFANSSMCTNLFCIVAFGLDNLHSIALYHPTFGPALMVVFACLSNTLLVTGTWRYENYVAAAKVLR